MKTFWKWLKSYSFKLFIAFDQLVNVAASPLLNGILRLEMKIRRRPLAGLWRFGFPDETLSSVFGKNRADSCFCNAVSWVLDKIDPNHSLDALEADEGKEFK